MYNYFIEGLQRLGRALMLPIAILPIAGLLLRLGDTDLLNIAIIHDAGQVIFANLAMIFAIGIAVGFAKDNNGTAGLAGDRQDRDRQHQRAAEALQAFDEVLVHGESPWVLVVLLLRAQLRGHCW